MTTPSPANSRFGKAHASAIFFIASGGVSAILPMAVLSAVANVYGIGLAGVTTVVLSLSGYAGQIFSAYTVEARIGRGVLGVRISVIAVIVVLLGCIFAAMGLVNNVIGLGGLFLVLVTLDSSRLASTLHAKVGAEAVAAMAIGAAALALLILPSAFSLWVVAPAGAAVAILARWGSTRSREAAPLRPDGLWIVGETAVTGLTQPALNAAILVLIGPAASVAFRMVNSLTNLFSPALSFLRVRLLGRHSSTDIAISVAVSVVVLVLILVPEFLGLWSVIFGEAWIDVTAAALLAGVAWKLCGLASTVPFARLRRNARARLVFVLRLISTATYTGTALIAAAVTRDVAWVFIAFAVSEALTAALYARMSWRSR